MLILYFKIIFEVLITICMRDIILSLHNNEKKCANHYLQKLLRHKCSTTQLTERHLPFVKRIFSLENVDTIHVPFNAYCLTTSEAQQEVVRRIRSHSSSAISILNRNFKITSFENHVLEKGLLGVKTVSYDFLT